MSTPPPDWYEFGQTFDVQPGVCWSCGAELEAATAAGPAGEWLAGQPCVCIVCTRVSVFEVSPVFGVRVVEPSAAELAYLEADPTVRGLQRQVLRAQQQITGRSMS